MKALVSTLAAGLLLAAVAPVRATDFIWNGNTSAFWDEANWSVGPFGSQNYPGQNQAGDTATINANTNNDLVKVDSVITYDVGTVDVDANAAGVSLTLEILSTGKLDTSGLVTLKSDQDGTAEAKLIAGSVDFTPTSLRFWGRNHATSGHAKGDVDESFTVDTDATVRQYADVDVLSGKTMTVDGTLRVGKDLDDYFGYLKLTGGGTVKGATVIVEGDASGTSTLELSSISLETK